MLYRTMPRTKQELSVLGFGCMRLPLIGGRYDQIDEGPATEMLRYAIDQGVNYVDTAWTYHGTGMTKPGGSEPFTGRALQNGYREKVSLTTKLPCWLVKTRQDMDDFLNRQLERLQTDHLDFYLLHGLNATQWPKLRDLGVRDFLNRALDDGRIRHAGFSFHDELNVFMEIVEAYDWTCCQIQYNYMDEEYQAGASGLQYAVDRGLGVMIMEPLRGGSLAGRIPPEVQSIWDRASVKKSPAEWGLRYVWNHPGVNVVLSGMSSMEQVEENIQSAGRGLPQSLSYAEIDLYEEVKRAYRARFKVDCTNCQYCMPCPNGVDIPGNFEVWNNLAMYEDMKGTKAQYGFLKAMAKDAGQCTQCGVCEMGCTQFIPIGEVLEEIAAALD